MRRFIARRLPPGNQYLKRRKKALPTILAATFMAMVFVIVTVSTITITSGQAFAVKKETKKVDKKKSKVEKVWPTRGTRLLSNCLLESDSQSRTSSSGAHTRCCSLKAGYCITCGTGKSPTACTKRGTGKYRRRNRRRN
jgi:hypothetical protein